MENRKGCPCSKMCWCPAQIFGAFLPCLLLKFHTCNLLWRITLLCENDVTWLGSSLDLHFSPAQEPTTDDGVQSLYSPVLIKVRQSLWYDSHTRAPCGINQLSPESTAYSTSTLSLPCFSHALTSFFREIFPNKTLH